MAYWCCYPNYFPNPLSSYNSGGCYNGQPYRTQFQSVNVSTQDVRQGNNPSADLTKGAEELTVNMHDGLHSCGEMMKNSSELSCDAFRLGKRFEKLTARYSTFSADVKNFIGDIKYPDFELVTNPKPTFDESGVWCRMNQDFQRHVGKQEFLQLPQQCLDEVDSCTCDCDDCNYACTGTIKKKVPKWMKFQCIPNMINKNVQPCK